MHAAARLPRWPARDRHEKWRAVNFRRSEDWGEAWMGWRFGILQRDPRHDLPGEVHWRRLPAGGLRRAQVGDGPHFAAQGLSRRHLQHESGFDGGRSCDFQRRSDPRELRARRKAQQEAGRWLQEDHRQGRIAGLHRTSRRQWRAHALSAGDSELPRLAGDRCRPVAALLVWHGEPGRDAAALLAGRAMDDVGATHRGGY